MRLIVGDEVMREDGRFYIPILDVDAHDAPGGISPIVTRVASDAFRDEAQAIAFAQELVGRWNYVDNVVGAMRMAGMSGSRW